MIKKLTKKQILNLEKSDFFTITSKKSGGGYRENIFKFLEAEQLNPRTLMIAAIPFAKQINESGQINYCEDRIFKFVNFKFDEWHFYKHTFKEKKGELIQFKPKIEEVRNGE